VEVLYAVIRLIAGFLADGASGMKFFVYIWDLQSVEQVENAMSDVEIIVY
jgi:hypothetical protein